MEPPPNVDLRQMSIEELKAFGAQAGRALQAHYVEQVELTAELWRRTARTAADRTAMVTKMTKRWHISREKARALLRCVDLFQHKSIRDAAHEGLLSEGHLALLGRVLDRAPDLDRGKLEAALRSKAADFDRATVEMIAQRILPRLAGDGTAT